MCCLSISSSVSRSDPPSEVWAGTPLLSVFNYSLASHSQPPQQTSLFSKAASRNSQRASVCLHFISQDTHTQTYTQSKDSDYANAHSLQLRGNFSDAWNCVCKTQSVYQSHSISQNLISKCIFKYKFVCLAAFSKCWPNRVGCLHWMKLRWSKDSQGRILMMCNIVPQLRANLSSCRCVAYAVLKLLNCCLILQKINNLNY